MNCEYIVHFVQSLDQMPLKGTFQVVAQQILACQGCPSAGHAERVRPLRSTKDVADEPGSLDVRRCVWNRRAIGGGGTPRGAAPQKKTPTTLTAELPLASTARLFGGRRRPVGALLTVPRARALAPRRYSR